MHFHSILFATDFSGRDQAAFKSVCQLAFSWNAKLLILHVQENSAGGNSKVDEHTAKSKFRKFVPDDIATSFDHFLRIGNPGKEILKFIEVHNVDLIALGTHGRTGAERVFSGSVAETVIRKANCPVMTIREDGLNKFAPRGEGELPRILVPVDFSVYGYAALDFAAKLSLETKAAISILYVDDESTTPAEERALWAQLRKFKPSNAGVVYSHKLLKGDPAKTIYGYSNSKGYDYVIIGTHGRRGMGRALLGSVAEKVVRHANCPVLTVKPNNKRASVSVI